MPKSTHHYSTQHLDWAKAPNDGLVPAGTGITSFHEPITRLNVDQENSYLEFFIIGADGTKKNFFDLPGFHLQVDWELTHEVDKPRKFDFTVWIEEAFMKDYENWNGSEKNEVQVVKTITENGAKNVEVVFDGYINSFNHDKKKTTTGHQFFKCSCYGSEQVFMDDTVSGRQTWEKMTTKEILMELSNSYTKTTANGKIEHRFKPPVVEDGFSHYWKDNISSTGTYNSFFELLKEAEDGNFIFKSNGEMFWYHERTQNKGDDLSYDKFGSSMTNLDLIVSNDNFVDRVIFNGNGLKGGYTKETKTFNFHKKKNGDETWDGQIDLQHEIYDIDELTVYADGWTASNKFSKSTINEGEEVILRTFHHDPDFKYNKSDKEWKYKFTGNTITVNVHSKVQRAEVSYWKKEDVNLIIDNETQIYKELKRRELTSSIFVKEISNKSIKNVRDALAFCNHWLEYNAKPQYNITMFVENMFIDHSMVKDWYDTNKYKYDFWDMSEELSSNGEIQPVYKKMKDFKNWSRIGCDGVTRNYEVWFHPQRKIWHQYVAGDGRKDIGGKVVNDGMQPVDDKGTKRIPLINVRCQYEMSSDKNLRWQTRYTEDIEPKKQRGSKTFTVSLEKDWDLINGSCEDFDAWHFNNENLLGNKAPDDLCSPEARGHLTLKYPDFSAPPLPVPIAVDIHNAIHNPQGLVWHGCIMVAYKTLNNRVFGQDISSKNIVWLSFPKGASNDDIIKELNLHHKDTDYHYAMITKPTDLSSGDNFILFQREWDIFSPQTGFSGKSWELKTENPEMMTKWEYISADMRPVQKGTSTPVTSWSGDLEWKAFRGGTVISSDPKDLANWYFDPLKGQLTRNPISGMKETNHPVAIGTHFYQKIDTNKPCSYENVKNMFNMKSDPKKSIEGDGSPEHPYKLVKSYLKDVESGVTPEQQQLHNYIP